jgi:hypothetical protein
MPNPITPHMSRFLDITAEIQFRDWKFMIGEYDDTPGRCYLVIEFEELCIVTGQPATQRSRKWLLSEHMTRGEVVQTAWLAVRTALMHEARESFKYRDRLIFGPHFDLDALVALCDSGSVETRPHPASSIQDQASTPA